jgi:methylase of polypeptide subunit release factors
MSSVTSEIQKFLKKNPPDDATILALEAKLAERFIQLNSLQPLDGSHVQVLLTSSEETQTALPIDDIFDSVSSISTDDLVSSFELLVPREEAKKYGAFFTPEKITGFMAQELLKSLAEKNFNLDTVKILDPAVGCGALLIAVAKELSKQTGRTFAEAASQLTGTDLSQNSILRAHILFELIALKNGDTDLPTPDLRLESGLLKNQEMFDGVIANPPYVRFQVMDDDLREELKTDWVTCRNGNYNLYFAFMEKADLSLNPNGSAYFITPNGFIDSKSGVGLRSWISEKGNLSSIIDFGKNKVFQVMTYTAINHFEKTQKTELTYAKVAGADGLDSYAAQEKSVYQYDAMSGGNPWNFIDVAEVATVGLISKNPIPLADVFDVRYGLATLRDKLFSFRSTAVDGFYPLHYEGTTYRIEADFTKKCIKVSGLKSETDIADDDLRIIYPYHVVAGKAVPMMEDEVRSHFPEAFKYLLAIKDELAKRDKGKKEYPEWFSYGRSQGLIPYKAKILTPLYCLDPRFMIDDTESLFINGCALVLKEGSEVSLKEAQKFLNSDAVRDFMLATSNPIDGGYVAYQKSQLNRIKLPEFGE